MLWFDTGTNLYASVEETEKHVAPTGKLGQYLHEYRFRHALFQDPSKGVFDLGDIAWMIKPELCKSEVIYAPTMDQMMFFDHTKTNGRMLRVYEIDRDGTWNLFYEKLRQNSEIIRIY